MSETRVEVVEQADKLSALIIEKDHAGRHNYSFGDGRVRSRFKEGDFDCRVKDFWKPDAEYHFLRTTVNPEAAAYLRTVLIPPAKLSFNSEATHLWFSSSLMDMYLKTLHDLLTTDGVVHIFYDLIEGRGVHSLETHWLSTTWPVIHCIRLPMARSFESYLEELHDRRGFELLVKRDAPQNYQSAAITALKDAGFTGILPLALDTRREWKASGRLLRDALDFLCPMTYSAPDSGSRNYYEDD